MWEQGIPLNLVVDSAVAQCMPISGDIHADLGRGWNQDPLPYHLATPQRKQEKAKAFAGADEFPDDGTDDR